MATVTELSDPYANFLITPAAPTAPNVCSVCLTFTTGYATCYPCGHQQRGADAVLPVSFSINMGQLHSALRGYKSERTSAERLKIELAAVLWRFLDRHEPCLTQHAGVAGFEIVTTVPSSSPDRDARHPLHDIVGRLVGHTAPRFMRLLQPSGALVNARIVDADRYLPARKLGGEAVLLVDDTWTTGANAESAALALKQAGAAKVGVVAIGRHIREDYGDNAARLRTLPPFSWERCALE